MIQFEIKNRVYKSRTLASEITLNELSKIMAIESEQEFQHIQRWLKIIQIVSDEGLENEIGQRGLGEFIKHFQEGSKVIKKVPKSIEVNGRKYLFQADPSAKAIQILEEKIAKTRDYACHLFAIMFEDEQLTSVEHRDKAHIDHKARLFGEQIMSDIALPTIVEAGKLLKDGLIQFNEGISVATA